MHWVDMEWLWGYHVLRGSIRDMLHFCRETGAKGNVNFDGIGYEKLAAEDPEALAELKEAVQNGTIEVVGASYGQPYGLFHGGESNIRQRIYGARAVRRLLGVWPKTFWEEEFDFFPQLPQMLKGVGFEYASLFFQWTWHTPEIPKEEVPVIWWEGIDGSRLLTATRNRLNLHQWPEDVQILMDELAENPPEGERLILQWLELMPSPDWMCRSEVLLPKTKELLSDPRFEVIFGTLSDYLRQHKEAPTRRYTMDQVWHGMSLGKNGDELRFKSAAYEGSLLDAEALASLAGLFGRPYAQWDVYPTWELEESWRELLQAQHHDNDECEGLCGHVGKASYQRSFDLSDGVAEKVISTLASRIGYSSLPGVQFNTLGWERVSQFGTTLPPFGYAAERGRGSGVWFQNDGDTATQTRGANRYVIHKPTAKLTIESPHLPGYAGRVAEIEYTSGGELRTFEGLSATVEEDDNGEVPLQRTDSVHNELRTTFDVSPVHDGVDVDLFLSLSHRPDPGMNASAQARFGFPCPNPRIIVDTPYAVHEVQARNSNPKKYPTGDWMTSPQWFETVEDALTAYSFVDLVNPETGDGLLILHKGNQQWLRRDGEVRCIVNMLDPWDGSYFEELAFPEFRIIPHGPLRNSDRYKLAQEFRRFCRNGIGAKEGAPTDLPPYFSFASSEPNNVVITALYRETQDAGRHVSGYAASEIAYPFVLRLVEFDGLETDVELSIAGTVAAAYKTNLLGVISEQLTSNTENQRSTIKLRMRAHEIATIYLDIVEGRKQTRDLDAARNVWATVHRVDE
jgi:alpha-mannosidase